MKLLNGTAIAIRNAGVLLLGKSGAGKSDLALRLIDRGAKLISDDRVMAENRGGEIILKPHPEIAGRLEVRGVGIISLPTVEIGLKLVVQLDSEKPYERLPKKWEEYELLGVRTHMARLNPFEISSPIKVEKLVEILVFQGR